MHNFILLENRKTNLDQKNSYYFHGDYEEIICHEAKDFFTCLKKVEQIKNTGKYVVGFICYEAGLLLQPKLHHLPKKQSEINLPLLHFLSFKKCDLLTPNQVDQLLLQLSDKTISENFIYNLTLSFTEQEYVKKITKIKQYLRAGDTYQVNFTGKYEFDFHGDPVNFYRILREQQRVEYSALLNLKDYQILSLSPELFFQKNKNKIITKPMKGTIPRGNNPQQDQQNSEFLQQDVKSRAENLMIVDLLRNDIGKIAQYGSVQVPQLFVIESFETLHAMVSEITGHIDKEITLSTLTNALFPCGSISGAPKLRTMEIIDELEDHARGVYTGAIGYITPENDMSFNVPIRTVVLQKGRGELGVGGGIVYDSDATQEFAEVALKAKFLTQIDPGFELIESFFYSAATDYRFLSQHLARLENSARVFNFYFHQDNIFEELEKNKVRLEEEIEDSGFKVRLSLNKNGEITISNEMISFQPPTEEVEIIVAQETVNSKNMLLQHKTTAASVRGFYNNAWACYNRNNNYFDVIFRNEHNYITEGTRSNIFIEIKGEILTPPIAAGLLPGIMRQNFINMHANIKEKNLTLKDLEEAGAIWVMNSVRGILKARCRHNAAMEISK